MRKDPPLTTPPLDYVPLSAIGNDYTVHRYRFRPPTLRRAFKAGATAAIAIGAIIVVPFAVAGLATLAGLWSAYAWVSDYDGN